GFNAASSSELTAVHAALQKRVSGTGLPGGTLTYSINFQLTDFPSTPSNAGANTFVVEDTLPDGLAYDTTLALVVNGATVPITPTVIPNPGTGETTLIWDIADAVGGTLANGANGSLTFRTNVLLNYANGDPVLASDVFTNQPELTYTLSSGGSGTDDSSISQSINPNVANKTIFSPNPLPPALEPGEEVVFELSLDIPAGNTADVLFVDFLPRPVFTVSDFNTATDIQILPPFSGLTPAVSTRTSDNSVTIDFGDISSATATSLVVRLSARLVGDPFADSLFLTNLLQTSYTNTNGDTISDLQAAGATVGAPSLVITKGVIEAVNPRATIIPTPPADPSAATADSNANGVDAADDVTFLVTVENVGSTEAFNVTIDDPVSAPFSCDEPAAGDIVNGSGDALSFSGTLATGIRLTASLRGNDGSVGAPYSTDTALMTIRCSLDGSVEPRQSYANEAGVTWTSVPDPSLPFTRVSDTAEVVIADPEISKRVVTISPGYSANTLEAHIGELITYEVTIAVPEGTSSRVRLQDILQNGLAAVDVLSLTSNSSALSSSEGSFADVLANLGFNNQGGGVTAPDRRLVFGPGNNDNGFGTITNSDTNNANTETITLRYRARVLNASVNIQNRRRNNRARWLWQPNGSGRRNVEARAERVRIIEPSLALSKVLAPDEGDVSSPPRVTLSFQHQGGSRADAFDLELSDALPANLFIDGAIDSSACPNLPDFPGFVIGAAADSLSGSWAEFPRGATCTVSFQTRFDTNPLAGERFTNCANLAWESLRDGDQPLAAPPNNTLGVERTGDAADPGQQNNYSREACDVFSVFNVGISKNLLSTDQAQTDNIDGTPAGFESLTIGELATFELVITIPDANVTELRVTDLLPVTDNVLELVSATATSVGSDLTADFPSGNPVISDRDSDGVVDQASFNFG
ncbi:MAG: isopeptide-forming domain-containing fimbrial protein, partial [Pseudomonadota bacterium]